MSNFLSTADAARVAGVGLTTVKRWADSGVLPCIKTAGGHRRFAREELERVMRAHGAGAAEAVPLGWIDLLLTGSPHAVEGALLQARGRLGAWHAVADELGAVLTEIGDCWRSGQLDVLDEHLASERLARALGHIGATLPSAPDAPRCLLACAEGEEHTLGLALAEICLCERGWTPLWAGRHTPTRELLRRIGDGDLALVALSASASSQDGAALARQVAAVARACKRTGARLLLGGSGAWPDTAQATRVHAFAELDRFLRERRR